MDVGATATGPAIITEDETTIIVPSSRHATRQPDGCIDMRIKP
jgi:N-methylhydantoinase A